MALLKFQMVNSADPRQDNQSYNMYRIKKIA